MNVSPSKKKLHAHFPHHKSNKSTVKLPPARGPVSAHATTMRKQTVPVRKDTVLDFIESANTGINGGHQPAAPGQRMQLHIGGADDFESPAGKK